MSKSLVHFLKYQQIIKNFFLTQGFIEVTPPAMVSHPGYEAHLHPYSVTTRKGQHMGYLQTSPEFFLKQCLSQGVGPLFSLSYSFRDEPPSDHHRPQFLMLEWYRPECHYHEIIDDLELLYQTCQREFHAQALPLASQSTDLKLEKMTIKQAFKKWADVDLDQLNTPQKLRDHIENKLPSIPLPRESLSFDDYFFLIMLNIIEPQLKSKPFLVLDEYPSSQAALAKIKPTDPSVCERFELYGHGVELANCFHELTDLAEQKKRFFKDNQLKKKTYGYQLPEPHSLFNALEVGLPTSSGIALGVERFFQFLTGEEDPFQESLLK